MTVPVSVAVEHYVGNDISVDYGFAGLITHQSELGVLLASTVQVFGTQYNIIGIGNAQCTVRFLAPPPLGVAVTIFRTQPISQLTQYLANEAYNALKIMADLDKQTRVDQMLAEQIRRAPKFPQESTQANIPINEPESNKFLGWNQGVPWEIENKDVITDTSVVIPSNNTPSPVWSVGHPGTTTEFSRSDHKHRDMAHRISVLDHGADPTGVSDSAAAFAAARTQALASGEIMPEIFIPIGNYSISGSLNANNVRYVGESMFSTIIYQAASATAVNGVFRADGTTPTITNIASPIGKGARGITLTSATGFAIGDIIEIRNTELAVQAADGSHNSHTLLTRVMDLVGAVVTLLDPLPFTVLAGDTNTVAKLNPTRCEISNLTINGLLNTGQAPQGNNGIVIFHSQNVTIEHVNMENFTKGYGIFLWSSYGSYVRDFYSQNCGDTVGFGSAFGAFDCTNCIFKDITALWPSRDGMTMSRCSHCQFENLMSIRAAVRNVKFHGCLQCNVVNVIGNNGIGGTGFTLSGGSSNNTISNVTTTGNKGPNASGNQNGVWFADLSDKDNVLSNVNSWDNGDYDITVFATDTGNIINGGHFSSSIKILNQNNTPMFNVVLDDVLSGGLTSLAMVDTRSAGTVGPSNRLYRHFPAPPGVGSLMGEYVFCGNNDLNELVEYAKIYSTVDNYNKTNEQATINISNRQTGIPGSSANFLQFQIGHGILMAGASGGFKGQGTINAVAVFDDNVLLTDYVLDIARQVDLPDMSGKGARYFDPKLLDPEIYAAFWKTYGHLPSMPSREEWEKDKKSLGELIQRLWETVEIQAVHIAKLLERKKE